MLLFELPPEVLILIYETLPDVRTLYNLTRTSGFAQEVYLQDSLSILKSILNNAYPDLSEAVKDTISAIRSHGELDYAYTSSKNISWIIPEASNPWNPSTQTPTTVMNLLQTLSDLVNDTEQLADWCTPHCQLKASWHWSSDLSIRQSVVNTILRLQLVTNRLYNVQLPAFPEHISLKTYEREKKAQRSLSRKVRQEGFLYMEERIRIISDPHARETCSFSRKTRDQARDLMKDSLRCFSLEELRNMWFLMQQLQDEYLLLRRHRLRPRSGSLMDLLFEHNADDSAWSCSPWFSVQSLLSDMGVHVVSARPGTSFRFLGLETSYDLLQKDEAELMHAYSLRAQTYNTACPYPSATPIAADSSNVSACLTFLGQYLERFRPLVGLPYANATPIKDLVEPQAPIRSMKTKRNWSTAAATSTSTSTASGQGLLGALLQECAERNQRRAIAGVKKRLRMGVR